MPPVEKNERKREKEGEGEGGGRKRKEKERETDRLLFTCFFSCSTLTRDIGTRDPLRAAYLSNTYDTHTRSCARSRKYARIKVYEERKLRKLHTKGTPANPRGRPRTYQYVPNVGYPLEYDQQLEVLF